jgi:superfamily I DNA/RNA helicase
MKAFVDIVEQHGESFLINSLQAVLSSEADAKLTLSTVHKAKGREWDRVGIGDDFSLPKARSRAQSFDPAEVRLLYVALTRAKYEVDIPAPLMKFFAHAAGKNRCSKEAATAGSAV